MTEEVRDIPKFMCTTKLKKRNVFDERCQEGGGSYLKSVFYLYSNHGTSNDNDCDDERVERFSSAAIRELPEVFCVRDVRFEGFVLKFLRVVVPRKIKSGAWEALQFKRNDPPQ